MFILEIRYIFFLNNGSVHITKRKNVGKQIILIFTGNNLIYGYFPTTIIWFEIF